jgi:hypothetical protein
MVSSSRIVILRHRAWWRDLARSCRIQVNDQLVARVRNGRTVELDVTPGLHQVQARIDWSGSPVVQVEAKSGAEVHLDLRPAGTLLGVYWRLFTRTKWLALRVQTSSPDHDQH